MDSLEALLLLARLGAETPEGEALLAEMARSRPTPPKAWANSWPPPRPRRPWPASWRSGSPRGGTGTGPPRPPGPPKGGG